MKLKHLSNKQGSASVIVIMVMLLLVVFGILAFVSGGSSLKLAEKNAKTVKDYYLLDKKGEIAVGQVLALLKTEGVGSDLAAAAQKATGIQDVTTQSQTAGQQVLTMQIQDPSLENGASLRIRLQPQSSAAGIQGLAIREWKLIYKPFVYDETVNLWDGAN